MGLFGFDSVADMFDGGGTGGSGDSFSTGSNEDYTASGGTSTDGTSFLDRASNSFSNSSSYTVAGGDTLSSIAARNGTTVAALMEANPNITNANTIYAGSSINIPGSSSSGSTGTDSGSTGDGSSASSGSGGSDPATETEEEVSNVEAAVERYREVKAASGVEVSEEEIAEMIADPAGFLEARGLTLADLVPTTDTDADGVILDPNDPRYSTTDDVTYDATKTEAETVTAPNLKPVGTVTTDTSADRLDGPQYNVDAVTGSADADNLVDASEYSLDMEGSATGVNEDGTTNYTGLALNDWASQDISRMIDTSTAAGKLLANKLGEGNYTDTKSTILGQMDILSGEFKDGSGNPVIPSWAQGTFRNVQRTIAFNGMTGTSATAAAANAIMEATLPIAKDEATFFQTLTIANLDNRQASILNKANTLAKFDMTNLSARENAAVQNAKTFLQFDLLNLENEQQAEVINTQARVDAMFTDVAEENVNRRLNIANEMENRQFYDTLSFQAATFNANSINANREANAGRADAASQFNISQTAAREQFEATMARSIDESNVGWRREVATTNTRMEFEAAAADVRTAVGLTTEGMNRMWDRVDSQLDYIWRSTEADEQRDFELLVAEMNAAAAAAAGKASAKGSIFGSIIGGVAKIGAAAKWFSLSDARLKHNIEYYDTMPNGVKVYTWDWNETAKELGADEYPSFGVLAQEIMKTHPDAVMEGDDGYLRVNYGKIQ